MTNLISPELLRTLGWTLLHFIWQGAALAALLAVAMAACRSAAARYALAVGALALMMASPVITFLWLHRETVPAVRFGAQRSLPWVGTAAQHAVVAAVSGAPAAESQRVQPTAMVWLVELWFLGVLILSLRTAGGFLLIERMRRKEMKPIGQQLNRRYVALQRRMGLDRVIRYCECHCLDAPAVLGWFRPVVLLPMRALAGMDEQQIEAVIAHELAHIRRLDCFVNLFQIAVETLLFYHPAVWWVSQWVRAERENCCDDEAISVCGDAVVYVRALTLMEEWRTAPALMMAANRSPLAERVVRLLGLGGAAATGRARMGGLGVSFACLTGALLAGNALLGVANASLGTSSSPKPLQESSSVIIVRPEPVSAKARTTQAAKQAPAATTQPAPKPQTDKAKEQQTANGGDKKQSYLDAMEAAGFKNLDVDEIIAMKVQGVTPEYIKAIHDLGLQPTPEEIVGMRVQGITPEYVRDMRTVAPNPSVDDLIGMKVQGVTPQYVHQLRDLGLKPGADEIMGMKVQGVTPEYVKELRATGINPDVDEIIGMKVQGVTAEFVKTLQSAGFKNLTCDDVIGAKVMGINSEFIEKARKHGFQNLTLDKLMALKHADIF
jgi:beta-lactamase regulating signal transducer with metallopeptidase domain